MGIGQGMPPPTRFEKANGVIPYIAMFFGAAMAGDQQGRPTPFWGMKVRTASLAMARVSEHGNINRIFVYI